MEIISITQGTSLPTSEGLRFYTVIYTERKGGRHHDTGIFGMDEMDVYKYMQEMYDATQAKYRVWFNTAQAKYKT
jgi:hypothetical protein